LATPAIEVRDLVQPYRKGTTNAVDGVSFSVEPGQFFALLMFAVLMIARTALFVRRETNR
jgi:hypothetical protein